MNREGMIRGSDLQILRTKLLDSHVGPVHRTASHHVRT